MKNYLVFFIAIFMAIGCGDTINRYYIIGNDGEKIPCPDNDCEGILNPDDSVTIEDTDQKVEGDAVIPDSDQDVVTEEESDSDSITEDLDIEETDTTETDSDIIVEPESDSVFPDQDITVNYCNPMVDNNGESMARNYSDANKPGDTKTVLTITLASKAEKTNCLTTLHSTVIPELNNFSFEAITFPVQKLSVVFQGKNCYLYVNFISPNTLTIQIFEQSTLDNLLDMFFLPK